MGCFGWLVLLDGSVTPSEKGRRRRITDIRHHPLPPPCPTRDSTAAPHRGQLQQVARHQQISPTRGPTGVHRKKKEQRKETRAKLLSPLRPLLHFPLRLQFRVGLQNRPRRHDPRLKASFLHYLFPPAQLYLDSPVFYSTVLLRLTQPALTRPRFGPSPGCAIHPGYLLVVGAFAVHPSASFCILSSLLPVRCECARAVLAKLFYYFFYHHTRAYPQQRKSA